MMTVGPMEIILVIAIIALLFGANRLPEIAKTAGTSLRELDDARTGKRESGIDAPDGADGEEGDVESAEPKKLGNASEATERTADSMPA